MGPLATTVVFLAAVIGPVIGETSDHFGTKIGKFHQRAANIEGEVYAIDDTALFVKDFTFQPLDTEMDAVFWGGSSETPDKSGFHIPSHRDQNGVLPPITDEHTSLRLPKEEKVKDLKWLAVWSKKLEVILSSVVFPENISIPQPLLICPLNSTKNGASSDEILILDSQTFLVPNFSFDGSGKDVHWWLSKGNKEDGLRIGENESDDLPLGKYHSKTLVISLPDNHTVFGYDTLSLYSVNEKVDYGSIKLPEWINVPPSPNYLDLKIQEHEERNKWNCEMLNDELGLEVMWQITPKDIIVRLVGNVGTSEYMALGLSKDDTETRFDSADVAVTWMDEYGRGHAVDYFFNGDRKCQKNDHGILGMCPDSLIQGANNNLHLISAIKSANKKIITYRRPLEKGDYVEDQHIYTSGPQAILWAVGVLQESDIIEPPKWRTRGNLLLNFGRETYWNCPPPKHQEEDVLAEKDSFEIRCPSNHLFRAQMGPSTDKNSHNIWYINGYPAPTLTVQRGQNYTFIVEGGMNPPFGNPLYITTSSEGGFLRKFPLYYNSIEEKFYAGVHHSESSNTYLPTSEGRLCLWRYSETDPEDSVLTDNNQAIAPLTLYCEDGNYATLSWTPNSETPDNLYYQSFTKRNIGGKIKILDFCEETNPISYLQSGLQGSEDKTGKEHRNASKPEINGYDISVVSLSSIKTKTEREYIDPVGRPESEQSDDILHQRNLLQHPSKGLEFEINEHERMDIFEPTEVQEKGESEITFQDNSTNEPINIYDDITVMMDGPPRIEMAQHSTTDSLHPHDESERSDKDILHPQNSGTKPSTEQNKINVGTHRSVDKSTVTRQLTSTYHSKAEPNQAIRVSPRFKPQFEGGFVPLVLNPIKEKESSLSQNFELPPLHLRRPHRPFLFNESIPFHGTFKPGVPDFSGFNISHYSQDDSYPQNHVLDHLSLVPSATRTNSPRPLSPISGLPPELFQRQRIYQRPLQMLRYGPRPSSTEMGFYQQPVFAQLPSMRIPSPPADELAEVSSQRVQVALQTPVDDKGKTMGVPHLQIMRNQDGKHNDKSQQNKLAHAPPIQRRPDFIDGEMPINPPLFKQTNLNYYHERPSIKLNNENQRIPSFKTDGLRTVFGGRRPIPSVTAPFRDAEKDNGPRRTPQNMSRPKPNFIQNHHREVLPQFPIKQVESALLQKSTTSDHSSYNKAHLQSMGISPNMKSVENNKDVKPSKEFSSAPQPNHDRIPIILKPELIQHSSANGHLNSPFIARDKSKDIRSPGAVLTGFFIKSSNFQVPPVQPVQSNGKVNVKVHKPLQDPRIQFNPLQFSSIPTSPDISLSDKDGQIQNQNIRKPNVTESLDTKSNSHQTFSFVTDEKKIQTIAGNGNAETEKLEVHPSEIQLTTLKKFEDYTNSQAYLRQNEKHDTEDPGKSFTNLPASDYDVPFGARLKVSLNERNQNSKLEDNSSTRLSPFPRKPQITESLSVEKSTEQPEYYPFYSYPKSPNSDYPTDVLDSISEEYDLEAEKSFSDVELPNSQIPLIVVPDSTNLSVFDSNMEINSSAPIKRFESLFLDDVTLEKSLGRKNILRNSSEYTSEVFNVPPSLPQNLDVPHISEKPPTHDNGTDYSILNHILTLIGIPHPNISPRHLASTN